VWPGDVVHGQGRWSDVEFYQAMPVGRANANADADADASPDTVPARPATVPLATTVVVPFADVATLGATLDGGAACVGVHASLRPDAVVRATNDPIASVEGGDGSRRPIATESSGEQTVESVVSTGESGRPGSVSTTALAVRFQRHLLARTGPGVTASRLQSEWRCLSGTLGRRVVLDGPAGRVRGRAADVTRSGELAVATDAGQVTIPPGEASLRVQSPDERS
jgi:hypothetical protein